jgi:porin
MHKILPVNVTAKTRIYEKILTHTVVSVVSLQSFLVLGTYSAKAETSFDFATPQLEETSSMSQVTNVNQLSDVQPTDWAFQALQSLVERYGCIAGYPNGTFRGNRAMTRYEFAAGLNACLNRVNELIATATADLVKKEDLATLQKLQEQFTAELATLRGRVDALESKSAELEANQFSTTTKLLGQVIMSANAGGFSGNRIVDPTGRRVLATTNPNPTVLYRASIGLNTSFTGTDLLKVQLDGASGSIVDGRPDAGRDNAAGVLEPFFGSQIDYSIKPATVNTIDIGRLYYTFKPTKDLAVSFGPDIRTTDYVDRNSYAYLSFLDFSTQAFINNYLLFPIDGPSSGAAIDWKPGNGPISVRALYAATNASNPGDRGLLIGTAGFTNLLYPGLNPAANVASKRGIFGSTYQSTAEIEYAPSRAFAVRLQYSGGEIIDKRFDVFGVNAELTLAEKFGVFGRYGYGNYSGTDFGDIKPNYWMAGIAMRDLFTRGALAGIAVGQPFVVNQIGNSTQTNYEAFYNYPFSRNIQITPTFQVIQNAGNQSSNGTIYTGTLRTVFSF